MKKKWDSYTKLLWNVINEILLLVKGATKGISLSTPCALHDYALFKYST